MFAALGAEPRLRILRLLLSAHPEGMVVGTISQELEIPASMLSSKARRKHSPARQLRRRHHLQLRHQPLG
jgi:hypothetical protein